MKVTTVRFGPDLWGLLETEAAHAGVSVSQFIREAALARAAAAAAVRGEGPFELLAGALREVTRHNDDPGPRLDAARAVAAVARLAATDARSDASALAAQSQQAVRRANEVAQRAGATTTPSRR